MERNVVYVARVKSSNKNVYTDNFVRLNDAMEWVSMVVKSIKDMKVVEIETRKRNELGLPLETSIRYFYEW